MGMSIDEIIKNIEVIQAQAERGIKMSIVITGEDMPTGCIDCPCRHYDGDSMEEICQALGKIIDLGYHDISVKRMRDCPLKEAI